MVNAGQKGWKQWHNKSYTGNMHLQDYQYRVQPRSRYYEVHQHIAVNIDIKFTNIWIKMKM